MSTLCTAWVYGKYLNGLESSVSGKGDEAQKERGVQASLTLNEKKGDLLFNIINFDQRNGL